MKHDPSTYIGIGKDGFRAIEPRTDLTHDVSRLSRTSTPLPDSQRSFTIQVDTGNFDFWVCLRVFSLLPLFGLASALRHMQMISTGFFGEHLKLYPISIP